MGLLGHGRGGWNVECTSYFDCLRDCLDRSSRPSSRRLTAPLFQIHTSDHFCSSFCSTGLESESRILSKRMSTASISSFDEPPYPPPRGSSQTDTSTSTVRQYPTNGRGEGGMLQRPATAKQPNGHAQAASPTHHRTDTGGSTNSARRARARTYSQPLGYDGPMKKGQGQANGLPTPGSSRSTSPLQNYNNGRTSDVKPTRIPIVAARGRAPSVSSYATGRTSDVSSRNGNGNGVYGSPPIGPQPNLYDVEEASSNHSKSTVAVPSRQPSGILDEPAPFKGTSINSGASNPYSVEQNQPPPPSDPLGRKSTDSEERPFEHWYRGDVYRNGGVGELRVGGKQEMLDIANYGHRFGGVGSKPPPPPSTPSTSRGRSEQEDAFPVRRKRAESVGARESFYMDEDRAKELSNVLNEDPLTDLEGDGDQDITPSETDHDYYAANGFSGASYSTGDMRSTTPTANNDWSLERERNAPQTRIPEPRQISAPPQSYNSSSTAATTRGGSEPPTLPATSSTSAGVRSQQTARSVSNPPSPDTAKRRAKSPPASVSSKKPKKASKSPARTKMADDKDRRSVAVYPELQGDDMENAIPSWTQPKPAGGNWDEVCDSG